MHVQRTRFSALPADHLRSRRACEAACLLGVTSDDIRASGPATAADAIELPIERGGVIVVTGESGAGKSTLLRDTASAASRHAWRTVDARAQELPDTSAIEQVGQDAQDAMRTLSRCGLGELALFLRRPREMSEGQRARLRIARAFDAIERTIPAGERVLLLCDEFGHALDPLTACGVARLLAKMVSRCNGRGARVTALVSTHHGAVARELNGALRLHLDRRGEPAERRRVEGNSGFCAGRIAIEEGSTDDYRALRDLHYRRGRPAPIVRILRAVWRGGGGSALAGVLAVSMPTLNARWRRPAWGDRYATGDKRLNAARVNAEIRVLSRIIVEPRFRGLGVARRLVETYLAAPETVCTESVAAMGMVCPFLERAGMTPLPARGTPAPTRSDARLLDLLAQHGVERRRLAEPDGALRAVLREAGEPTVRRELALWAQGSRARGEETLRDRFARACAAIACAPVAYAHTAQNSARERS